MQQEQVNMEVAQKAIVFRDDGKFLTVQRGKTAPTNPGAWDLPGGVLESEEDPVSGIIREIKEETGLTVSEPKPFDVYGRGNYPLSSRMTIAYHCRAISTEVTISWEHTDFKWVTKDEFLKLPASPKITRFVKNCVIN